MLPMPPDTPINHTACHEDMPYADLSLAEAMAHDQHMNYEHDHTKHAKHDCDAHSNHVHTGHDENTPELSMAHLLIKVVLCMQTIVSHVQTIMLCVQMIAPWTPHHRPRLLVKKR